MEQLAQGVLAMLSRISFWSIIDIGIVAVIIFGVLMLIRGTSAFPVLYGIVFLMVALLVVASLPQLIVLNWLLGNALPILSIAVLILFQPELRRAMERLGRFGVLINRPLHSPGTPAVSKTVDEICRAARRLSERRYGALIVLEREVGLQDYAETGVQINGAVSAELLLTLFFPNSPLHDGAVIVRGDKIVAAAAVLPLSESLYDTQLGTRHRAGLGITERSDALAIIISEETGTISFANNGRIVRHLDESKLQKVLTLLYRSSSSERMLPWVRRRGEQERGEARPAKLEVRR